MVRACEQVGQRSAVSTPSGPTHHVGWAAARFGHAAGGWEPIRDEFTAYTEGHLAIPDTASVSGLDPDSDEGRHAVPVVAGRWRSLVIGANGQWVDATARFSPKTKRALEGCPQMTTVGFSVLEPHPHISGHVGTNRRALRVQLPLIVPGEVGTAEFRSVMSCTDGRRAFQSSSISASGTRRGTTPMASGCS